MGIEESKPRKTQCKIIALFNYCDHNQLSSVFEKVATKHHEQMWSDFFCKGKVKRKTKSLFLIKPKSNLL